ncbi:MAG: hypothetical protein ACON4N_10730 [Myxococcota bacterium]
MRWCLALIVLMAGCNDSPTTDDPSDTDIVDDETLGEVWCENLSPETCLMPFPSDRYRRRTASGSVHVALELEAMPTTREGDKMGVEYLNRHDGFGVATPILFQLPGATLTNAPGVFQPQESIDVTSGTLLINAETGELVPHWAEFDYVAADAEHPVIALRAAAGLERDTRYIVAVHGLTDTNGSAVPAPEGFAALRDAQPSTWFGVGERRAHFEAVVFPVLETAGVDRASLQLAWDFTTASETFGVNDLVGMRDHLFVVVGDDGPGFNIDNVDTETGDPNIAVIVDGTAFVPNFLMPPDADGVQILRRNPDGTPTHKGLRQVPFRVQFPYSALDGSRDDIGVLQYGHGFLGSQAEARNGWLREMAQDYGFVILSSDMTGMSEDDATTWIGLLSNNPGAFPAVSNRAMQGIIEHAALVRMMKGGFTEHVDPDFAPKGVPAYDPSLLWYYGNSQGGSVGNIHTALQLDIQRSVLGVPGGSYPLLMHRSSVFAPFLIILQLAMPNPIDRSLFIALIGTGLDPAEPLSFAPYHNLKTLPDTPAKQTLLHVAKGDAQVHPELSFLMGRANGATLLTPAVREVWGLPTQAAPIDAAQTPSVLVEMDFGIKKVHAPDVPPPESPDSHGWLRKQPEAQAQMMSFLRTGIVPSACGDDPCVFDGEP